MSKLISIILTFLLCMVSFSSYAFNDVDNTSEVLNVLQEEKNEIEEQIQQSQQHINEIDEELSKNMQQIAKLDIGIKETETTLITLNNEIISLEVELKTTQNRLDEVTTNYNTQKDLLDKRLVAMYMAGDTQYLDVLLASTGIIDFISNYYLVTELVEYDTKLLEIVEQEKTMMEFIKNDLSNKQTELNKQKQEQLKIQNVLENNKIIREKYVKQLNKEESELQEKIDEYYKQIQSIETEIKELVALKSFGEEYKGGTMVWPIEKHYRITSRYGMRTHPITGVYKLHTGIDISAQTGVEFRSAAYGMVIKAGYNSAYGNMVIIDHGGGVQTLYAHGSSIEVKIGDVVNAGDVVLKVGSTGYSTGPHAHFEIRIKGDTVNPLDYISIPSKNVS